MQSTGERDPGGYRWRMSAGSRRRTGLGASILASRPSTAGIGARMAALPRMIKASVKREYDGGHRLWMMAAAALYIASPIDFVPELVFWGLGLIDDAFVISWLAGALLAETE